MQQSKTVSASQIKNNFGALVSEVRNGRYPEILVENRGEPIVAIVSISELEAIKEFREQEKRKKALALLREARTKVQARINGTLTDKEADQLANRFSREFIEDLAKEGKVKFEPDSE